MGDNVSTKSAVGNLIVGVLHSKTNKWLYFLYEEKYGSDKQMTFMWLAMGS